jgi:type II secretory pathway pseudopilin PulG
MIKKNRGLTIIELLIYFVLVSIALIISIRNFKIFRLEAEITNGVRVVIASLNTARYNSVSNYEKIKVLQDRNNIFLQKKINGSWKTYNKFIIRGKLYLKFNNSPIFSPLGSVAPLCSVYVWNNYKKYKSSISMSGRIKTREIKL